MANKNLFDTSPTAIVDTENEAGGAAIKFSAKHQLAQYVCTGCFNDTFYAKGEDQLDKIIELCQEIDAEFIAKTAIYARTVGFMKDMPALLTAILATKDISLLKKVFPTTINNVKMLRNFVQIIRSGVLGRKSLGTASKKLVQNFLNNTPLNKLFYQSVGKNPSLADIIKMVHPKPQDENRSNFYKYVISGDLTLPNASLVTDYEVFKNGDAIVVPDVPFQMLDSLDIGKEEWIQIAKNANWHTTRMNLKTFARHGVFDDLEATEIIAARLSNADLIKKVNVFPYQLLMAFTMCDDSVPTVVKNALQDAMEIAIDNVPELEGNIVVCPDTSASMGSPVTGYRHGSTSAVTCVDVSALFSAAILRKNPNAEVLPFDTAVHKVKLNPRDSVMTNAKKLSIYGGGTDCAAPLRHLNKSNTNVDVVILVSDNESWFNGKNDWGNSTAVEAEFDKLYRRNKGVKLICIDIQPYDSGQAKDKKNVLNIGGFSDNVFKVVSNFVNGKFTGEHWVSEIAQTEL